MKINELIKNTIILSVFFLIFGCNRSAQVVNPSGVMEATEVDIAPVIAGRIISINAMLGQNVLAGDTLIKLDTELIQLQKKQTSTNRLSISAQRKVAHDGVDMAQTNLDWVESSLARALKLQVQGSATQQQIDDLTSKRDQAIKQLQTAKHQLDVLDAETNKLNAALDVLDRQVREGVIISPLGGTVILRSAEPGEVLTPGEVALRIADINRLELKVYLDEMDLDKVKLGQQVSINVDAMGSEAFIGVVSWVSSEAEFTPKNAQTRDARSKQVYAVKIAVDNKDGRLHIGMPAEVVL